MNHFLFQYFNFHIFSSEAFKLILKIWKVWEAPEEARELKRRFDKNISLHEVFLESVPSAGVMTILMVNSGIFQRHPSSLSNLLSERGVMDMVLFWTGFASSVLSASLGLAKCLLVGPARIMTADGPGNGLFSGRFIIAFWACALSVVCKGVWLAHLDHLSYNLYNPAHESYTKIVLTFSIVLPLLSIPNLFFALSIFSPKKRFFKMLFYQPSLFLMPYFTMFSFSKIRNGSCGCGDDEGDERISFSIKYTWINIFINIM